MIMLKIEREYIDALGGKDAFDAAIVAYRDALKIHAETEGEPAPVAATVDIERIVKQHGGKYKIIEPEKSEPEPDPSEMTLEDKRSYLIVTLATARWQYQISGVEFGGYIVKSDAETLAALVSATFAWSDQPDYKFVWKVNSRQFINLTMSEVLTIVGAIRAHTQDAFQREANTLAELLAARHHKELDAVDIEGAFV